MTARDDALLAFQDAYGVFTDEQLHRYDVAVVVRSWPSGERGMGSPVDTVSAHILPRPRVQHVSERIVASSGGKYESGDLRVTKIIPHHAAGGYTPQELKPAITPGSQSEVVVKLVSDDGPSFECSLVELHTENWVHYEMVLRRRAPR